MALSLHFLSEILRFASAGALGLFIGALLIEAMVLVPMWRSMQPDDFYELHASHAHRLYDFFAPLTVSATLLTVCAAITSLILANAGAYQSATAAVLALVIMATYLVYFKQANARFAEASIANQELPAELKRWASWHWFRTGVGLVALAAALLALRTGAGP